MTKICKVCNNEYSTKKFNYVNKIKGYLKPYCKSCEKEVSRERYIANAESYKQNAVKWQEKNREKYLEYQKQYNEARKNKKNKK